ncbi:glycosyltransferase involved in cell wall biosynthesis [Dysgonomonas sp. PFB1-18]|uniref:glycosyltransferase n=1 Tax=unclassified Dysgonomonas TaxID=2630389 RepID=UPI002475326A|nr:MULTISPECIES: glycosyltransferase [unclassified Dysgonomonas]MDL2302957.1 glycosyltransferase [Dysgonomonas sp. OttesenSCG-928-D17]MDH6308205.1 glycosyltransferase involved in cell wall biosynthesis [Dysgonomonas sp. PF1-14]MDH6338356.1 glycosyltransferase involved in cell wall biosynthesis [Dysgonomonas sp. PF1-16]MDH6379853.1 glycosyltransferase involved in cell wall biosynthesis [Dysgonomonas sp. PFB1-18]MDH6397057.1 glycosyltransferase involved in cell wall biosynthesis [Dysgonomonas sp
MKRILFFNDSLVMGGTEVLLVDLLNHLVTKECEVTLLLPEHSDENVLLNKVSPAVSVKYLYPDATSYFWKKINENVMIFFPRLFARQKGIDESDYDEIVCFKETFFARIFSRMSIRKILWIHNIIYKRKYEAHSFREKLSVWLNKKQLKRVQQSYDRFDEVICVSDAAKNAYVNVLHDGKQPNQDIRVLYNAIDMSKVVEKSKESIIDLPQGRTNFILITRVSPEKRTDRLLNAAAKLKSEGYDFHVYILGDGMDSQYMKNELVLKGLDENITLKGRTDNPFPYILQSKWSLCVSERESFSLVLLESMALKTPVITTNCGGPSDVVDGGKYGILVDNSTEGVYQGMKMVLDDPALSVRYSAELDKAVERFDYKGWLQSVYKLLLLD